MPFPSGDFYDDQNTQAQWNDFTEQMGIDSDSVADAIAQDLLYTGWFDGEVTPEERHDAREEFFEYMEMDDYDFPWAEWEEWYDEN